MSGAALLPLPEDLSEIKAQAVICKLAEIEPVDEDWSEEARDFFSGQCKVVWHTLIGGRWNQSAVRLLA